MVDHTRAERLPIQVPVNVCTDVRRNRVGVSRDLSSSGVLFHSLSQFAVGERVEVTFRLGQRTTSVAGQVVRAFRDANEASTFRFLTAVKFDSPLPDPKTLLS